jgi:hypothetical protein
MTDKFVEQLEKYTIKDLRKVAEYYDIILPDKAKKSDMVELIKKKIIPEIKREEEIIAYGYAQSAEEEEKSVSVRVARILESMVK